MSEAPLPAFDSLWNYDNPAETEMAFRRVLSEVDGVADDAFVTELKTQIARTFSLRRQFDEAHRILDEVEASDVTGRPRIRYLLERGRTFNSSKQKDQARPLFLEAWDLGRELGEDGLAVDAAHMVAIVESEQAALDWNLKALELATASSMPAARKWRKSLHNNMGWTYFDMGELDKALHHFQLSRECAEEGGDVQSEQIARWCIAKTHRLQGQVELALEMQLVRLAEVEAQGQGGGFVHEEIAECLLALGSELEAAPYFGKAFDELSKDAWLVDREPERLKRLSDLAGRSA